jgi:hypothetical protein
MRPYIVLKQKPHLRQELLNFKCIVNTPEFSFEVTNAEEQRFFESTTSASLFLTMVLYEIQLVEANLRVCKPE